MFDENMSTSKNSEISSDSESEITLKDILKGMKKLATKDDLQRNLESVKSEITQSTKILISEAVDPLKVEIRDHKEEIQEELAAMKLRLQKAESQKSQSQKSNSPEISRVERLADKLDPAHRRIAFLGFDDQMPLDNRVKEIDAFIKKYWPTKKTLCIDHFYKGPYNERKESKNSFAEFANPENVKQILKQINNEKLELELNSKAIVIK